MSTCSSSATCCTLMEARRFRFELPDAAEAPPSSAVALTRRTLRSTPGLALRFLSSRAVAARWRAFCVRTARSLSIGRGLQTQHCHSSGTSVSTMSKQAAWHQREHESQPMEKPSSYVNPQMQLIASEVVVCCSEEDVLMGGGQSEDDDCFLFKGIVDSGSKDELRPSKPSAASVASLRMTASSNGDGWAARLPGWGGVGGR